MLESLMRLAGRQFVAHGVAAALVAHVGAVAMAYCWLLTTHSDAFFAVTGLVLQLPDESDAPDENMSSEAFVSSPEQLPDLFSPPLPAPQYIQKKHDHTGTIRLASPSRRHEPSWVASLSPLLEAPSVRQESPSPASPQMREESPQPLERRTRTNDSPLRTSTQISLAKFDGPTSPPSFSGNAKPAYPAQAYRQGIEGEVTLKLFIAESGRVQRVDVARSSGHAILDAAAVEAVSKWRGEPARRNGQPVATVEFLPVNFRLH